MEIWLRKRMRRSKSDLCELAAADRMGGMGVRQGLREGRKGIDLCLWGILAICVV